ncbi:hypothetical protein [Allomesorhizobium camelthorni]|uniref:Uncharacterized protein n=1 Tax=Allomesorhizobium camelthorni TaxID=475069 RepID=A0A6G4W7Y6_9HYPH|nr:hypothetical protein [Mesorhizobium camelthorni]NGO50438.1 hypothetical protein [Mesorhizobium camelthorni]
MRDLHNNINIIRAVSPVAIGTTGTGKTSGAIDLQGYDAAEVEISYGTVTATNAVFTALITECDTATGTFTSVADADLLGTEADAGLAAAATRTSGTTKNVSKRVGYIGTKRYIKAKVSSTVTAGTPIGVNVIRGRPHRRPTT